MKVIPIGVVFAPDVYPCQRLGGETSLLSPASGTDFFDEPPACPCAGGGSAHPEGERRTHFGEKEGKSVFFRSVRSLPKLPKQRPPLVKFQNRFRQQSRRP
jgi:hypothetical protein